MNAQRMTRVMLAGAVALALTALTVLLIALPATAGPTAQDWTPIPTPTSAFDPRQGIEYVLTTAGGDDTPQVFPGQEVNGVTFGETTVETEFPNNLYFYATIESDTRQIERVDLLIRYNNGAELAAQPILWDDEAESWRATWMLVRQIPAWAEVEFRWVVRDAAGERVFTEPQPITLVDPNQVWNRVENDYAILYWYGFGGDQREDIARQFTRAVTTTHARLIDGFGRDISYKPINIIYPNEEAAKEVLGWTTLETGLFNNSASLGLAAIILTPPDMAEKYADCPLFPSGDWPEEYRLRSNIESDTMWSFVDYFPADILRTSSPVMTNMGWDSVNHGPIFWLWGQSRWFIYTSFGDWPYEEHAHQLAAEYGIDPLRQMGQSDYIGPDGCPGYLDEMGASFINWLVFTYGIETHRQIVELMIPTEDVPRGMPFEDAIQQATGKPFDELENEWRAYLELPPLE
jgi:hypothetical protein